jgi:hypothetical protein
MEKLSDKDMAIIMTIVQLVTDDRPSPITVQADYKFAYELIQRIRAQGELKP